MINSKSVKVCATSESRASVRNRSPLYTGIPILTRGSAKLIIFSNKICLHIPEWNPIHQTPLTRQKYDPEVSVNSLAGLVKIRRLNLNLHTMVEHIVKYWPACNSALQP